MIQKIDYPIAALIGFLTGVFAIPTVWNVGLGKPAVLLLLPLALPPLWVIGLWLGNFLSRWIPFLTQFSKFVVVGFLNTAIDFGILNLLSMTTGISAGLEVGGVNIPGFGAAVLNSYFWNKLWVFRDRDEENIFHDFPKFFMVVATGLVINSGIVILMTTYIPSIFPVSPETRLNLAKASANVLSLIWNFFGLKFLVFRPSEKLP